MDSIKMATLSKVDKNLMRIPPELMQFAKRGTYSLLIKGNSGTGKTTLSLTILRALESRRNFFYISTRLSPRQLFVNYPWLDKFVVRENIEDNESSNQRSSLSSFEDARLDEPESLFERITNQLMDVKAPIIIIDSWDAIASFMDTEARLNNERVLQTWRERAGAKLIFTSEDIEGNPLDFLVDGIVELRQETCRNINIRQIFLAKLRGTKISRPSYIFTLNNGMFRSYSHYDPCDFFIANQEINPLAKKNEVEQKTSSLNLKSSLNKAKKFTEVMCENLSIPLSRQLTKNRIILLEVDQVITPNACMPLLAKIISQFIEEDDSVIVQPFLDIEPGLLLNFLQPYMHHKPGSNLRIFHHTTNDLISEHIDGYLIEDTVPEKFKKLQDVICKIRNRRKNKSLLSIMMLDDPRGGSNGEFQFQDFISYLRSNANLSIFVSIYPHRYTEIIRKADLYLRLKLLHNTLFLQSIIPNGHSHAILVKRMLGVPTIKLDCLV